MYLTASSTYKQDNKDGVDIAALGHLCYHAARMYNVGLYSVRQHFFQTGKYLSYYDNYHCCKSNENYSILLTDTGQQILRLVDRDMKSFFALLFLKQEGKYSDEVHLPRYKDKQGMMTFVLQGRSVRRNGDKLRIGLTKEFRALYGGERYIELTLPKHVRDVEVFKEVRVIPKHNGTEFKVEFVYACQEAEQVTGGGYMSIDPGLDNLLTCTIFSDGHLPKQFIIDGRYVKSVNAYYNKVKARLQSEYGKDKSIDGMTTKRFNRLSNGRDNRIDNYFSLVAKHIVAECQANNVTTVVWGYNLGQKQGINIGVVNNQNFVTIPHSKLRSKVEYKCKLAGITVVYQEESYTSKASSLDEDVMPVYGKDNVDEVTFSGKRIKRGLYRSQDGSLLNADVNGSVNILRKYFKESKMNWCYQDIVRAFVNTPCPRIGLRQLSLVRGTSPSI